MIKIYLCLATCNHVAYTPFIYLPSALVLKVNPFSADIGFVQFYSLHVINIVIDVKHVGGSCLICKSSFEYNTAVIIMAIDFSGSKQVVSLELLEVISRGNSMDPLGDSLCVP